MNKFREGQILIHKISENKFVIIKYRCLLFKLLNYFTTKNIIFVSSGEYSAKNFDIYESELRQLTDEEIKQDKKVEEIK